MDYRGLRVFDDGRWLIQITRQGIQRTKRGSGGRSKGEAAWKKIDAELNANVDRREAARKLGVELDDEGEPERALTFAELYEQKYIPWAESNLAPSTRLARESTYWHLLSFFGATPIDKIS